MIERTIYKSYESNDRTNNLQELRKQRSNERSTRATKATIERTINKSYESNNRTNGLQKSPSFKTHQTTKLTRKEDPQEHQEQPFRTSKANKYLQSRRTSHERQGQDLSSPRYTGLNTQSVTKQNALRIVRKCCPNLRHAANSSTNDGVF
jgi:hypothetical protein